MSGSYRDLRVWQSSMTLVITIYSMTREFPNSELYGPRESDEKSCRLNTKQRR